MWDEPHARGGWLKTVVGALAGMFSGALVMWFSPFIDHLVKPPKPVANFAVEHHGLTVTFHNRSMNGGQGRWDFGDGSPLEFVSGEQPSVKHTYPKPSTYVATFTVTNVIGEESDRSVTIELTDREQKFVVQPSIIDFRVRPPGTIGQPIYAPATFQFEATADDTETFIWDFGEGKGLRIGEHQTAYTYSEPGAYTVTLVAVNGKKTSQFDETIDVLYPPDDLYSVSLKVTDRAVSVETEERQIVASQAFHPSENGQYSTARLRFPASPGFEIIDVRLRKAKSLSQGIADVSWQINPDRNAVEVIARPGQTEGESSPILNEHLVVTEQKQEATTNSHQPVAGTLNAPGNTALILPPTPLEWKQVRREYTFELRHGGRTVWAGRELPQGVPIQSDGRTFVLSTIPKEKRIEVRLTPALSGGGLP